MKKIVMITCCMIYLFIYHAQAQEVVPKVIYDGDSHEFSFENTQMYVNSEGKLYPDLFNEFKQLLPGDSMTQTIDMEVVNLGEDEVVNIYLQAENDNDYEELLQLISITVIQDGVEISQNLEDTILLGSFHNKQTSQIQIQLDIPLSTTNEIQNLDATTCWIFSAEVMDDTLPDTSDHSHKALFMLLFSGSIIVLYMYKKEA